MTRVFLGLFLVVQGCCVALANIGPAAATWTNRPLGAEEIAQGYRNGRALAIVRASAGGLNQERDTRTKRQWLKERVGIRAERTFTHLPRHRVLEFDPSRPVKQVIRELQESGLYDSVEFDRAVYPLVTPNDPAFSQGQLWGLHNTGQQGGTADADVDAPEGWDTRREAPNIVVAVIDSGIRLTHEDLRANLWTNPGEIAGDNRDNDGNGWIDDVHGINAITAASVRTDPTDDSGHGTHVAGTIGAAGNNGRGVTGVAWRVKLMALKFLPAEGTGSVSDSVECINYAIAHGAHVINASYGSDGYVQFEYNAIRAARDAGIIVVAAAGNEATDNDTIGSYPANYALANIVSVAATDRRDQVANFSNRGSGAVDLAAPGQDIYSTTFESDTAYGLKSGTSMATPHVTGIVALLRASRPTENYRQVINRLLRGVDQVPDLVGRVQTGGRANLARALGSTSHRPFNDDFALRARLEGANVRVRNVNTGGTRENGEPAHAGQGGGASLWWEWTAPASAQVVFDTADSDYDTVLAVYTGTELAGLALVGSSDNHAGGVTSRVSFQASAGTRYQIAVDGKNGATGLTMLRIGAVPSNDNLADAVALTGANVRVDASNRNASKQPGEPNHAASGNRSVWYRWVAPANGRFQVAAFSAEMDTLVGIYTGSDVANLQTVATNDDAVDDNTDALATFSATVGATYLIAVDSTVGENGGAFILTINDSVWQGATTDEITGSPAVAGDGTVYVGSVDHYLYAFDASGSRKWRYNAGAEISDSAPAIGADGTIYIGSVDGALHAVTPAGARRWRTTVGSTALGSTPALAEDGTIYFRDAANLHAFTPNGSTKWSAPLSGDTYSSPVVALDGTVYIGATEGKLLAVNSGSGSVKWTFTADGDIFSSPAIGTDGTLYFATLNGELYAVTPQGKQKWSTRLGGGESMSSSPVLGPDGTVYVASYDRRLYAVSANGAIKWSYLMEDEVRASSPAVSSDGTVYIGCYDGRVYAVSSTGALVRTLPTAQSIRSSMTLVDQRLYFASADAKLYAFAAAAPAASPWPQFQHAANRDGRASATTTVQEPPPPIDGDARVVNLSTRARVDSGEARLIGGFFVSGGPRRFLIRGVGPTLGQYGVSDTLADPQLALYSGDTVIQENDDWGGTPALINSFQATGAFQLPADSTDAALLTELTEGIYSAHITSKDGSPGNAIVEVYEIDGSGTGRLLNLSTRAPIREGLGATAGFVVTGGTRNVLVRAVGPTLVEYQVKNAASNPRLILYREQTPIAENDDWGTANGIAAAQAAAGAFPLPVNSQDAALLRTLTPGPYSFVAEVGSGTAGVVLLEVYILSP